MTLDQRELATLAAIADHLVPAAGDMPSAAAVVDADRLEFVLRARPDLAEPLRTALAAHLGDDPATSVLDRWNRAHDVANLYVVDGSCFVTSTGVNPTSTIVAIAMRAADHMIETRFEQQVPV